MEGNRQWDMGWEWMAEAQHNTTMKARDILGVSSIKPAKASSMACLSGYACQGGMQGRNQATNITDYEYTTIRAASTTTSQPN